MKLTDQLLKCAEGYVDKSENIRSTITICKEIGKFLPRMFPAPDDIYIHTPDIEYDVGFIYKLEPGERDESLRLILSLIFSATDWSAEILDGVLVLRSSVPCGPYYLVLRIEGANIKNYELTDGKQVGARVVYNLRSLKFAPWETPRSDVTPEILIENYQQVGALGFASTHQAKIFNELAINLPEDLPEADEVTAAIGLNYDAEIIYLGDPRGKKRRYIDRHLGYTGWSATITKQTGDFDLHAIFLIKSSIGTLRVKLSILDACKDRERLFIVADLPDVLLYRAVRPSDPDYKYTVKMFKGKHGGPAAEIE
jgi:hypothetical protein